MKTTIVIPTYNEAENLPKIVKAVFAQPIDDLHMIIVDDGSPDGTGEIAENLGREYDLRLKVIHRKGKLGLGTAYITGFKQALADGSEIVGQMDADFSHQPEKLLDLIAALETVDMALGSRYIPGGKLDKTWPFWRKALSSFGNFYARTILALNVKDVTGGFRVWRRTTLRTMDLDRVKSNGYVFQVEMLYYAHLLGFKFKEVPIYFADRREGTSKMSFGIQREAAMKTWSLLSRYRDLRALPPPG